MHKPCGQTTAQQAMSGWMASPGHKANILATSARELGVGFATGGKYGYYWTQEFGARPGFVAPSPTPSPTPTPSSTPRRNMPFKVTVNGVTR